MLLATRSAHISDVYRKKEKHHEKRSYQDSSIDGNVACNGLGFGPGRYFAGTSLLSESVSTEITLGCGREGLLSKPGCPGWVAGLSWPLTSHVDRLTRYSCSSGHSYLCGFWQILVKRRLYREFPFFFAYISAVIVVSGIRFWAIHDYSIYFKVFWSSEALYTVMALLALHEAFIHSIQ